MSFSRPSYTWCNERIGLHKIDRKLDRALSNGSCMNEWDSCNYQVPFKKISDHSPILASKCLRKVSNFCGFKIVRV